MITLLLILAAFALQSPKGSHPVRWTREVGPNSRQALEAKLMRPVKLSRGVKIYEHTDQKREIRTCADYAHAMKNGWRDNANTYEMTVAASFKEQCDLTLLILAAKPSRVSYVRNFKLDEAALDLLPPSLSFAPVGEIEQAADEAERQGLSWKKFNPGLKLLKKSANWMVVEEPDAARIEFEIEAFGDFNGDDIEDLLLFKLTCAFGGTFCAYYPVILTRMADGAPLKAFEVEDEDIEKARTKLMRTGTGEPPKARQPNGKARQTGVSKGAEP